LDAVLFEKIQRFGKDTVSTLVKTKDDPSLDGDSMMLIPLDDGVIVINFIKPFTVSSSTLFMWSGLP
jgi:hypothetical protein